MIFKKKAENTPTKSDKVMARQLPIQLRKWYLATEWCPTTIKALLRECTEWVVLVEHPRLKGTKERWNTR